MIFPRDLDGYNLHVTGEMVMELKNLIYYGLGGKVRSLNVLNKVDFNQLQWGLFVIHMDVCACPYAHVSGKNTSLECKIIRNRKTPFIPRNNN